MSFLTPKLVFVFLIAIILSACVQNNNPENATGKNFSEEVNLNRLPEQNLDLQENAEKIDVQVSSEKELLEEIDKAVSEKLETARSS